MANELVEFDLKFAHSALPALVVSWRKNWVKRMDLLKIKIDSKKSLIFNPSKQIL